MSTSLPEQTGRSRSSTPFARWWRHLRCDDRTVARRFPAAALDGIEASIAKWEQRHSAELRFVIEADLSMRELWRGVTPRERALAVFSELRVWDTEHNAGVLVYVLWADHAAEIVADRGIAARVAQSEWDRIMATMTAAFAAGRCQDGAVAAVEAIGELLARHFPADAREANPNELPDRPTLL